MSKSILVGICIALLLITLSATIQLHDTRADLHRTQIQAAEGKRLKGLVRYCERHLHFEGCMDSGLDDLGEIAVEQGH